MNSLDSNSLLRLIRTFTDLRDAAAAALLAVIVHPMTQHKEIAKGDTSLGQEPASAGWDDGMGDDAASGSAATR